MFHNLSGFFCSIAFLSSEYLTKPLSTMRLRIIAFIFCIISFAYSYSQDGSVRVRVFAGGNLDFVFNSISDYKTGITFLNYTVLGIEATDLAGGIDRTAWRIEVSADDADGNGLLDGTNPANTLPFSTIEVQATSIASCVPLPCPINLFGSPWLPLATAPTIIVDGNAAGGADDIIAGVSELAFTTDQINISYRVGFTTSLLGEQADFYSDEINFVIFISP